MASRSLSSFSKESFKFDVSLFQNILQTKYFGKSVCSLDSVPSTQDLCFQLGSYGSPTGTVVVSQEQTQGRGRAGRSWTSLPSNNLYFSLLLRPASPQNLWHLNLASCVAIARTCANFGVKAGIKWPNDVWIGWKKVAGVLLDSSVCGSDFIATLGIGINLNQSPPEGTSVLEHLSSSSTSEVSQERFLASLLNELEDLVLSRTQEEVLELYRQSDILLGKKILVSPKRRESTEQQYYAVAIDFDANGLLVVDKINENSNIVRERLTLSYEDVSIRPDFQ